MILILAAINSVTFAGGIALSFVHRVGFRASVSGSLFVIASMTFMGLLSISENVKQAIAGSFIVAYFALLFTVIFARVSLVPDAKDLVHSFTWLTGVVVSGYFGSSTIEKVSDNRAANPTPARGGDIARLKEERTP
jgi:hypothetical protein